jgi:autotransporter-associated beta strand protein
MKARVLLKFTSACMPFVRAALLLPAVAGFTSATALADSAKWKMSPTNDWNMDSNWAPRTIPNGPADIATFGPSKLTSLSISANVEVNAIVFGTPEDPDTPLSPYNITAPAGLVLTMSGVGIINSSGLVQNFITAGTTESRPTLAGTIIFKNAAVAGSGTVFTNRGASAANATGGELKFTNSSSANRATIVNNGAEVDGGLGGKTEFLDTSSAADGNIILEGGANGINFTNGGGQVHFRNSATAGNAKMAVNGGHEPDRYDGHSMLEFWDTATAGQATFTVAGGSMTWNASRGFVIFHNNSSAGAGHFSIEGPGVGGGYGGQVEFRGSSNAGSATFTCNGATEGYFVDENGPHGNQGSQLIFRTTSTAGAATIVVNAASVADGLQAILRFTNSASAGNATIVNDGSALVGQFDWSFAGGRTEFFGSSNAGSATVIASGAGAAGAPAGLIEFAGSHAASATLIANGGTNGGAGGTIIFVGNATGDASKVQLHGNGMLDISDYDFERTGLPPLSIGSLEGDGIVFLGANELDVGANNASTTFQGTLHDGTLWSSSGPGSLRKLGDGTLILTGANSYTGGTTIDHGVLKIDNTTGSATGSGPVTVNPGGTLAGNGSVDGSVTVQIGATLSPGDNIGTLTIRGSLILNDVSHYFYVIDPPTGTADKTVANGVSISRLASISLVDRGFVKLPIGTIITVIDNQSLTPINGTFRDLPDNSTFNTSNNKYLVSYHGGDGNDLTLTVIPRIGILGL